MKKLLIITATALLIIISITWFLHVKTDPETKPSLIFLDADTKYRIIQELTKTYGFEIQNQIHTHLHDLYIQDKLLSCSVYTS